MCGKRRNEKVCIKMYLKKSTTLHQCSYIFLSPLMLLTFTNGVPTGGACVLSVIRFQDVGRRSAVVSTEARL